MEKELIEEIIRMNAGNSVAMEIVDIVESEKC